MHEQKEAHKKQWLVDDVWGLSDGSRGLLWRNYRVLVSRVPYNMSLQSPKMPGPNSENTHSTIDSRWLFFKM